MSRVPLAKRLDETVLLLHKRLAIRKPRWAVVLGTGLGAGVRSVLTSVRSIDFTEIPHVARSTAPGHAGRMMVGHLDGQDVVVMEGRFHYYEGYSLDEITYPIRVLQRLGVESAIFTNVTGGLNPSFSAGDLVLITDHLNLMGVNPLIGPNDEALGPRFPDMSEPYHRGMSSAIRAAAADEQIALQEGVYAAVAGPNLETRAEYRYLRQTGADLVGMSTVPEVLVAVHAGIRVAGISVVTDVCIPDTLQPVSVETILRIAGEAEPVLSRLLGASLRRLTVAEPQGV